LDVQRMGEVMTSVLTDGQWAVLAPLIEACRPHHKTQHHDLRRTIEAIIWRCQNGTKWRSLPAELGPRSGLLT
jgi:transposase